MTAENTRPIEWPHAPVHRLLSSGTYFVTASTYRKQHYFRTHERLGVLHRGLLSLAKKYEWHLEAWAVFSNHYHFVGHSPAADKNAASLPTMLRELHSRTAVWINGRDNVPERQVWFNYRETLLTHPGSYMGRLQYTHNNPVKHGLVDNPTAYPYCSAAWFERTATSVQQRIIAAQKIDQLKVYDEFEVVLDD